MAQVHGIKGLLQCNVTAVTLNATRWTLDIDTDLVDVTKLSGPLDIVYKEFVAGATDWSGSFEGWIEDNAAIYSGSNMIGQFVTLQMVFPANPTAQWSGTAQITGWNPDNDRNDACKYSGTFQGTGLLNWPS